MVYDWQLRSVFAFTHRYAFTFWGQKTCQKINPCYLLFNRKISINSLWKVPTFFTNKRACNLAIFFFRITTTLVSILTSHLVQSPNAPGIVFGIKGFNFTKKFVPNSLMHSTRSYAQLVSIDSMLFEKKTE